MIMIKKHTTYSAIVSNMLIIILLYSVNSEAQVEIGIKKLNIWTEFGFASPKQELKNSYSLGDPMKLYLGADLPFAFLRYSKKHNTGISLAAVLDHEKANFENNSNGPLGAKITSVGLRVRPFGNMAVYQPKGPVTNGEMTTVTIHKDYGRDEFGAPTYHEYTTTESTPVWSEEGAKLLVSMVLSGFYCDFGTSHIALIEPPAPTVNRTAFMYSIGCAPAIAIGRKVTFFVDLSVRNYKWTNKMNTTSAISSFHTGFGIGLIL